MPRVNNPVTVPATSIADAVWDESTAGHVTAGSFGRLRPWVGPLNWQDSIGVDFWAHFGHDDVLAAADDWLEHGWATNGTPDIRGGAGGNRTANFLQPASEQDAPFIRLDAAGDRITSPFVFGAGAHIDGVERLLGAVPTVMRVEFCARFSTVANDEQSTYLGLANQGGAAATEGVSIHSDGTNWRVRNGGSGTEDAGAAVDADRHIFSLVLTAGAINWEIDGVNQGEIAEAPDAGEWPCALEANIEGGGSNVFNIFWFHVRYE